MTSDKYVRAIITIMGTLLYLAIIISLDTVWQLLEVIEFGHVTPSFSDLIIGIFASFWAFIVAWNSRWWWRFLAWFIGLLAKFIAKFY